MPICQNPDCNKEFNQSVYCRKIQKYCSKKCNDHAYHILHKDELNEKERIRKRIKRVKEPTPFSHYADPEKMAKIKALAERQQDLNGFLKLGDKCEVCGATQSLLIHHIKYSPLETVTLCASCHGILHHKFLRGRIVQPKRKQKTYPLMIRPSEPLTGDTG